MKTIKKDKKYVFMFLLCIMMLFISSCQDQIFEDLKTNTELQNKDKKDQTQTRSIGSEGFFENYVDIEDFKNFQYESDAIWIDHQSYLDKLSMIDVFPNISNKKYTNEVLTKLLLNQSTNVQNIPEGFDSGLYYDYMNEKSFVTNYDQNKKVDAFVEVIFERDYQNGFLKVLSPKEAYNLLNHQDRTDMRFRGCNKNGKFYFTKYLDTEKYSEITGVDELDILNLRIITFTRLQIFPNPPGYEQYLDEADLCHYIYQFPYKDNYKDYQNESLKVTDDKLLKKYIKPGSILFVYDKNIENLNTNFIDIDSLIDDSDFHDLTFNGHSIVVTNYWYDLPDHMNSKDIKSDYSQYGYQSIDQYKSINENSSFLEVDELRKDAFDDNISLKDYLKRFVFIEAITTSLNDNSNILYNDSNNIVKYTTGNDKFALERFDNYTVFAISNLNNGYKMTNTMIQKNMIKYSKSRIGKEYTIPNYIDELSNTDYCSGLVIFGYKNYKEKNNIKILRKKHKSKILTFQWYMPRTLTNSPFVYTRILYK